VGADPAEGVRIDLDNADDQIVCPVPAAGLGRFFSWWEKAIGGAYFGGTDLRGAGWPAAARSDTAGPASRPPAPGSPSPVPATGRCWSRPRRRGMIVPPTACSPYRPAPAEVPR